MAGLKAALKGGKLVQQPAHTEPAQPSSFKRRCGWSPEDTSRALLCVWTVLLLAASLAGLWFVEAKIIPGTVENGFMYKTRCHLLNASLWPTPVRCAYPECAYHDKFFEPDKCRSYGRCVKLSVRFALANGTEVVHTRPLPTLALRNEYVAAFEVANSRPYKGFETSKYSPADGIVPPVRVEGGRAVDLIGAPGLTGGCSALTCRADPAAATAEAEALLAYWPPGSWTDCLYMTMPSSIDALESGNAAPPVVLEQDVPPLDLMIYTLVCFAVFVPVAWACLRRAGRHNRYGQLKHLELRPKRRASTTTHDEPSFHA